MMKTTSLVALLSLALCFASSVRGQTLQWTRQLGTSDDDQANGVSADGLGNVYISGETEGSLDTSNAGGDDAFISKYDANGTLQWTRQLGTSKTDISSSVSADGLGSVYISGLTSGNLEGTKAGGIDAFLSKYDANGLLQWTRLLGTSSEDRSMSVSADGLGSVYISGRTRGSLEGTNASGNDAFLSKYDANGMLQWTRQFGSSGDTESRGVSADRLGSVYISGQTEGSLDGANAGDNDAFLSKYDANGLLQWTRQLGTSSADYSRGVSADGLGNVYISGYTAGSLGGTFAGGSADAFISKYDAGGMLEWTRQLGTSVSDVSKSVSTDGLGSAYITGMTFGSLEGANAGSRDAFISKFDAGGMLQWTRQLGTSSVDWGLGVSADGVDSVYITGLTEGSLVGTNAGGNDAFVAKYTFDFPRGDFDRDRDVDGDDVDALVGEIVAGVIDSAFDLTRDGEVDNADLSQWLVDVATANDFAAPLLLGDANLDGSVDSADLNNLAISWRQNVARWTAGDFTADGIVDPVDLNWLAINWQQSIPSAASAVPEPATATLAVFALAAMTVLRRRTFGT